MASAALLSNAREEHIVPKSLGGKAVIAPLAAYRARKSPVTSTVIWVATSTTSTEHTLVHQHAVQKQRPIEFPVRIIVDGVEEVQGCVIACLQPLRRSHELGSVCPLRRSTNAQLAAIKSGP
jgi:hypothetical protein